jgi:hypothetical protein
LKFEGGGMKDENLKFIPHPSAFIIF